VFNLYPNQHEDFGYGYPRSQSNTDLIGGVAPSYLVPTSAAQLPATWNQPVVSGGSWTVAAAPGGVAYDTASLPSGTFNAGRQAGAVATQSSNYSAVQYLAVNGVNGITTDFTHTLGNASDPNPWWLVTFPSDAAVTNVQLYNRTGCCPERLRDITVQVLDASDVPIFTSSVLNRAIRWAARRR
jgi:hypothetical protein